MIKVLTGYATMGNTPASNTTNHSNMAKNTFRGAATGAVTQINGNSGDIEKDAPVGIFLGLLSSIF